MEKDEIIEEVNEKEDYDFYMADIYHEDKLLGLIEDD